ncbi:L-threonine ammonia-lyase-like [Cydia strobilella]|uniref:L-threonine ammonia-lyase-like n=1 Tax=Cydia strobilella TaxID=1100964 RepID=UPI0030073540
MEDYEKMEQPHVLNFNDIKQAIENIEGTVIHTPLCEAKISKYMDYNIYLKCENLQYTGSVAERGVRNAFCCSENAAKRGVVVPSNGSMALAAAYHGRALGVPVMVVLPERTPPALVHRCSELGADVVMYGENVQDATNYAQKVADESHRIIMRSDDPAVMAGLGTVGVEIVTQLPELDAVIVPVASGGLLAAILVACKKLKCSCLVYGAECAKVPKMMKALQAGKPMNVPVTPNLAEGLNASSVGANAFATIRGKLDRMLVVEESSIAQAMVSVLERERLVADGAGVCAVAAVIQGLVPELRGKRAVCVISGGNIDCGRLSRNIQRGLGASGRLLRFSIPVPDHRNGLANLAKVISEQNVVLKSMVTDQMPVYCDVGATWANVVVETGSDEQAASFKDHLRDVYPRARFTISDLDDKHKHSCRP